ncbi:hypothetical protein GCM10023196_037150 [Actinoallomurus vinaceus]|uniref:Uncharacterized protein n=1 Tax=Actinoallomurus vinaceus TaxID=1080074 RepID=A0ABP8U9A4_9ACTN
MSEKQQDERGPKAYLSAADIGAMFDVDAATVAQWRKRYENFPEPDVKVGIGHTRPIVGWDPAREQELRDWEASRPGRGWRGAK